MANNSWRIQLIDEKITQKKCYIHGAFSVTARELVVTVKKNITFHWSVRESVQVKLKLIAKRILKKFGILPTSKRRQ
jgi:hypothetical protein